MHLIAEKPLYNDNWLPVGGLAGLPPLLMIIVDTEEEFDWNAPFDRMKTGVNSMRAQYQLHEIYDRYGVRPTYVMDYPVASQPEGYVPLKALLAKGQCLIGAHLHPWVNLPHEEEVNDFNSYPGNLPPALERRKLEVLTDTITRNFGQRPTIYKAGRYGLGPQTFRTLSEMGYEVDLSPVPYTDFGQKHGPDFSRVRPNPYWIGAPGGLLTVPLTRGFFGALDAIGAPIDRFLDTPLSQRLMLRGILSRSHLLERSTLTPEGVPVAEHIKLVGAMIARGHRIFSLTYHSPSLEPGHTSYVRTPEDLKLFINSIETFLETFMNRFGGKPTDPLSLRKLLLERMNYAEPAR
jgi:hypothetical protein